MDVRVELQRKLSAEDLMLLGCDVGDDYSFFILLFIFYLKIFFGG